MTIPTRRELTAAAVFAVWCVSGLFLDGWSHQANKPETFFTPWHGLLYSGFGAALGWGMYEGNRARLRGEPKPVLGSDLLTRVGAGLFVVGMVGDLVWHEVLGVEVGIDALLSPTHLMLMSGGIFLASIGLRAAMADGASPAGSMRWFLPTLASAVATTGVVAFFLQYTSAYDGDGIAQWIVSADPEAGEVGYILGSVAILVTNAIFVSLTTLLTSRWSTPFGSHTIAATVLGGGLLAQSGFTGFGLVVAAAAGGLAADVAVRAGRRDLAGVAQAAVTWPVWFVVAGLSFDMGWSANPIGGALVMTVLSAFFLRLLASLGRQGQDGGAGVVEDDRSVPFAAAR